jgi:hypothetical protein
MTRWFGLLLCLLLGLLIGLSTAPLLAGEWMTVKQFYLGVIGNILAAVIVIAGFWGLNFLELRFNPVRKFFGIRSNTTFPIFIGYLACLVLSRRPRGTRHSSNCSLFKAKLGSDV